MTRIDKSGARLEPKVALSVVVVYEDSAAQERAIGYCDQLVRRFWGQCEFDLSWWPFAALEESPGATEAALKAAEADLILFSAAPEGDFPAVVKVWIDGWLRQRGEREGILLGLMGSSDDRADREGPKHCCLRSAAHHGALDYLTDVPREIAFTIPDSLDAYSRRADCVTRLLDDILHRGPPPPDLRV